MDADLAEVMKKLAKDKMLRALSNVAYAKGDYEKEMGPVSYTHLDVYKRQELRLTATAGKGLVRR